MLTDSRYTIRFKVLWSQHEHIRLRLDRIARQLGALTVPDEGQADGAMSRGEGGIARALPDELRALQQDLASEAQLSPRDSRQGACLGCAAEWVSLERQRRTLKEQLNTLIELVETSGSPVRDWGDVLSHFCFFALPLRAYLLQRCDLLRRTMHSGSQPNP